MSAPKSEGQIIALVAAVQFINILDFMMVMPLGPDFARALQIPTSKLGLVGGSYTAAAAIAGLLSASFLDRFDRRRALGVAMLGLVVGTALGGFATSFATLLLARVVAGAFGGPAASLSISIVSDVVPPERRGRAMGLVMAAFSAASIFGVPAGLELARLGSWRTPFLSVAAFGLVVSGAAFGRMPPMRGHLAGQGARGAGSALQMLARGNVALSLATTAVLMVGTFALVPNISAYVQLNAGYPRDRLGTLYLVGGVVSLVLMQISGRAVDKLGGGAVAAFGTAIFVGSVTAGFLYDPPLIPVLVVFVLFMASQAFRAVPANAVTSKVPRPEERARFQSMQSAVQHMSAAAGAMISSHLLSEGPGGRLVGMPRVAAMAIAASVVVPALLVAVERSVRHAPPARAS